MSSGLSLEKFSVHFVILSTDAIWILSLAKTTPLAEAIFPKTDGTDNKNVPNEQLVGSKVLNLLYTLE